MTGGAVSCQKRPHTTTRKHMLTPLKHIRTHRQVPHTHCVELKHTDNKCQTACAVFFKPTALLPPRSCRPGTAEAATAGAITAAAATAAAACLVLPGEERAVKGSPHGVGWGTWWGAHTCVQQQTKHVECWQCMCYMTIRSHVHVSQYTVESPLSLCQHTSPCLDVLNPHLVAKTLQQCGTPYPGCSTAWPVACLAHKGCLQTAPRPHVGGAPTSPPCCKHLRLKKMPHNPSHPVSSLTHYDKNTLCQARHTTTKIHYGSHCHGGIPCPSINSNPHPPGRIG